MRTSSADTAVAFDHRHVGIQNLAFCEQMNVSIVSISIASIDDSTNFVHHSKRGLHLDSLLLCRHELLFIITFIFIILFVFVSHLCLVAGVVTPNALALAYMFYINKAD